MCLRTMELNVYPVIATVLAAKILLPTVSAASARINYAMILMSASLVVQVASMILAMVFVLFVIAIVKHVLLLLGIAIVVASSMVCSTINILIMFAIQSVLMATMELVDHLMNAWPVMVLAMVVQPLLPTASNAMIPPIFSKLG